jgi:hypothetical protein
MNVVRKILKIIGITLGALLLILWIGLYIEQLPHSGTLAVADCGAAKIDVYWFYQSHIKVSTTYIELIYNGDKTNPIYYYDPEASVDHLFNDPPLPLRTDILTAQLHPLNYNPQGDTEAQINMFVDAHKFSKQQFKDIARCVQMHEPALSSALSQAYRRVVSGAISSAWPTETFVVDGLAYIGENDLYSAIHSVNTDDTFYDQNHSGACLQVLDSGYIHECGFAGTIRADIYDLTPLEKMSAVYKNRPDLDLIYPEFKNSHGKTISDYSAELRAKLGN